MRLLHIDSSARPGRSGEVLHGSHTRRLTARFVERWRSMRPRDAIVRRDLALAPPAPVDAAWVEAAFTRPENRSAAMRARLAESDALVDELIAADLIVAGVPMYNFGMPATFKAYVDNVVRVGRTFGFDRGREGEPYWPMLEGMGKTLVVLSSRGDWGYEPGGRQAVSNHVEPAVRSVFHYLGIDDWASAAVEYDEFGDARLAGSLARAEAEVDAIVDRLLARHAGQPNASPGVEASIRPIAA